MNMMEEHENTRVEYERRFLVAADLGWERFVEPYSKLFEDKYLLDTRLRLRRLTDSDTGRQIIKLTKKDPSESPYFGSISRILLSGPEYEILLGLEGFTGAYFPFSTLTNYNSNIHDELSGHSAEVAAADV